MHSERLEVLKDNEEHVKKGGKDSDDEDSDEDEANGGTELKIQSAMDDDGFDEDTDEEWEKQQKIFNKLGPKLHNGKVLTADEMKEFGIEDDYNDEDDDDDDEYEYNGGDMSLYDSAIDDIDEI
jgi:hypothetical protein